MGRMTLLKKADVSEEICLKDYSQDNKTKSRRFDTINKPISPTKALSPARRKMTRQNSFDSGKLTRQKTHSIISADAETQTDLTSKMIDEMSMQIQMGSADSSISVASSVFPIQSQKKKIDSKHSANSILGGKKEKAMSISAALELIPDFYEQYMKMIANPGPDTESQHLNFVKFVKDSLVRKFGIKQIATKQLKAFLSCLLSDKAMDECRLRVVCQLLGLPNSRFPKNSYIPEFVDFFFKTLMKNLFSDIKRIGAGK